jgi:hypothetical protein
MLYAGLDLSRKRLDFHLLDADEAVRDRLGRAQTKLEQARRNSPTVDVHAVTTR